MSLSDVWKPIDDQRALEELVARQRDFHDAIVVHSIWEGMEKLLPDKRVAMGGPGNIYLSIHSQLSDVEAIDLRLLGVRCLEYRYDWERETVAVLDTDGVKLEFLAWRMEAQALEVRRSGGGLISDDSQ